MSESVMTPERWARTGSYIRDVFCREDGVIASVMPRAKGQGLPAIDAGPETGRFLQLLVILLKATNVIEVGTLAGYSAIWMARGIRTGGMLRTIDVSEKHIEIAKANVDEAGVGEKVTFLPGKGLDVLPRLLKQLGPANTDLIFLDAARDEYVDMLPIAAQLLRPGGVLVIDNALNSRRWVADVYEDGEEQDVMDRVNRRVAQDPAFESTVLSIGNEIVFAVRKG